MTKKLHPLSYSKLSVNDAHYLSEVSKELWPTGSMYLCSPRPEYETDEDILVLVEEGDEFLFEKYGFVQHYEDTYSDLFPIFVSLRKGSINLVVTYNKTFFRKFKDATEEAKEKNILNKEDRIKFFSSRLYGEELSL